MIINYYFTLEFHRTEVPSTATNKPEDGKNYTLFNLYNRPREALIYSFITKLILGWDNIATSLK